MTPLELLALIAVFAIARVAISIRPDPVRAGSDATAALLIDPGDEADAVRLLGGRR